MGTKATFGNDLLAQASRRAAERAGAKFRQDQIEAYKADLQKAAEKLGLELTEENLPVIAREMRSTKKAARKTKR